MFVCCGGGGGKQPRTTTRPVRAEASSRLTVAHDTLNQTRGPGGVFFFFRSHCGARNVKLEYISVGYSKTRDPTKAVTHTHTQFRLH